MKRVVLITGGTSGFGLSAIKVFLREEKKNIQIISLSRSIEKIVLAKKELGSNSKLVDFLQADVSKPDELEQVAKQISKKYGHVDVLVNNAGTIIPGGVESLKTNDWDWVLTNNLSSYFYTTKIFLPLLKASSDACVVNISSTSAKLGGSSIAYSVAKAGVDMITRVSAKELSKYKIRVNAVSPGVVNTGFHVSNKAMDEETYNKFISAKDKEYPLGLGDPSDVAEAIYYLSSPKAKWLTGTNILVDGGRSSV